MRIPGLGWLVDERFLEHRRRSTSLAGLVGVAAAYGLFMYRLLADHVVSWDLFAIVAVMAAVKIGAFAYYRLTG